DAGVDAVLALVLPTAATGDLITALRAADVDVPLAAVVLDQAEAVRLLPWAGNGPPGRAPDREGSIPAYADPAAAARGGAPAGAWPRGGAWGAGRAGRAGHFPELGAVRDDDAGQLVRAFLARSPHGGWLPPSEVPGLLACYGIPLASRTAATDAGEAV